MSIDFDDCGWCDIDTCDGCPVNEAIKEGYTKEDPLREKNVTDITPYDVYSTSELL